MPVGEGDESGWEHQALSKVQTNTQELGNSRGVIVEDAKGTTDKFEDKFDHSTTRKEKWRIETC